MIVRGSAAKVAAEVMADVLKGRIDAIERNFLKEISK